jgi:hypothetical protein
MRPRRFRSNSSARYAGVRDATSIEEAVCAAKAINFRVRRDRLVASSAQREMYLRLLMGLPAVRSLVDDSPPGAFGGAP